MKKFLIKSIVFFCLIVGIVSFMLIQYGGYIDFFYNKFTTPLAKSLIIGDSRGLQGIQPAILDSELEKSNFELPTFNYSFTIAQAHIGPLYRKSVLRKLNPDTQNGVFIISITPWMLGSKKDNDNFKGEFKETNTPPHNMINVTMSPNYEYFLKNTEYFNFKGVFRKNSMLHKDGWLEANNLPKDSITFVNWKNTQLEIFKGFNRDYVVSEYRMKSLDTLIKDFKRHGKVFIVRSPIDQEMLSLENDFFPNFDNFLEEITISNEIKYFNFTLMGAVNKFKTYDGHHLDKLGGKRFTQSICDSILKTLE
jgi:hypothetical protein